MKMSAKMIKTIKEVIPVIYAYTTPDNEKSYLASYEEIKKNRFTLTPTNYIQKR